ncbi:MAG: hypothetical protein P4M11_10320 [Candidatus Pacebacteria bacterium]|nr:hypothetical protein [Candidatus Paceibacterota bacterium]
MPGAEVSSPVPKATRFSALGINESGLEAFLRGYLGRIPQEYVETFGRAEHLLEKTFASISTRLCDETIGAEPRWLGLGTGANQGLCAFCTAIEVSGKKSVELLHVSPAGVTQGEDVIRGAVQYVWRNTAADEIRVKLYHRLDPEGKYLVDPGIQRLFAEGMKFKWIHMINDDRERYLALALKRPKDEAAAIFGGETFTFSFRVGHFVVLDREMEREPAPTDRTILV